MECACFSFREHAILNEHLNEFVGGGFSLEVMTKGRSPLRSSSRS